MKDNAIQMFIEKYENEQSGEMVDGVTILIDGKFKQILDIIIQKEERYRNNHYLEVMRDILFSGIECFIKPTSKASDRYKGGVVGKSESIPKIQAKGLESKDG